MPLNVSLFGLPSIMTTEGQIPIPLDKRGALLIYLAYKQDWLHREQLSFLFWPDSDDKTARRNLRQIINRSKKLNFSQNLEFDGQSLRWLNKLDTTAFTHAIAEQNWAEATKLYQGEFCEGLLLADSNGFQEWLTLERDAYASAFITAVRHYADFLFVSEVYGEAAALLSRALKQDDLAEDLLQRYLRAAYLADQKERALKVYRQFQIRLKDELGLEPLNETQGLVNTIEQSQSLTVPAQKSMPTQLIPLTVMRPPKLVGRQIDLETVHSSNADIVFISGVAGVGKTRFMAEIAPDALLVKAQEGLNNIPFNAIVSLIKEQTTQPIRSLGVYKDDLLRLIPELEPETTAGPADPLTARQRLLEALALYFEACASGTSFHIVFDDLQWLDASSLEFLIFLANRKTLKVLASYRKYELASDTTKTLKSLEASLTIELEPLAKADIEVLLANLMGYDVKPQLFASWLHENTGGNTMFVLETLKSLFEAGDLKVHQQGWYSNLDDITQDYSEFKIPVAVSELIQRRIEPLGDEVKRVLQSAAVMGKDFKPKQLSQLTGLSEWSIVEALEKSEQLGITSQNRFNHDLLRQSIYKGLSSNKKILLHARIAEILSGYDELIVAEHWLLAQKPYEAASSILKSARQQRSIGLQAEALSNLRRALSLNLEKDLEQTIRRLVALVHIDLGQFQHAEEVLISLLEESVDPEFRVGSLTSLSTIYMRFGQIDKVIEIHEKIRSLSSRHSFSIETMRDIQANEAVLANLQGDYAKSVKLQLECNDLCRTLQDNLALALGLSSLGANYDYSGYVKQALTTFEEALALSKAVKAPHVEQDVAVNLVSYLIDLNRHKEAIEIGENALALGHYDATDYLRNNLAVAYLEIKDSSRAVKQFEVLAEQTENIAIKCNAWARLVHLYANVNLAEKLELALRKTLELAEQTDSPVSMSRAIVSCLQHGSSKDKQAARLLLVKLDLDTIPPVPRAELEQVLKSHF